MYLLNSVSLQIVQQLFIAIGRFRTGQGLDGVQNAVNHFFTIRGAEKFVHNLPFLTIAVFVNGVRMTLLEDYTISESGGPGTGYDTIYLGKAPYATDNLLVDFVTP